MAKEDQAKISINSALPMDNHSKVTVEVKIISKGEAGFVGSKQLPIQDLKVADSSGSIRLTVWVDTVDKLEINQSYQLQNVTIREYRGKKFLSASTVTQVTPINDIGSVKIPTNDDESGPEDPAKHLKECTSRGSTEIGHLPSIYVSSVLQKFYRKMMS